MDFFAKAALAMGLMGAPKNPDIIIVNLGQEKHSYKNKARRQDLSPLQIPDIESYEDLQVVDLRDKEDNAESAQYTKNYTSRTCSLCSFFRSTNKESVIDKDYIR